MSEIDYNPKLMKNKEDIERDKKNSLPSLSNKTFAFTGRFETDRKKFNKMLSEVGAVLAKSVEKDTDYLVKGDTSDFPELALEQRLYKAENMIKHGRSIRIISEKEFLELINNAKSVLS